MNFWFIITFFYFWVFIRFKGELSTREIMNSDKILTLRADFLFFWSDFIFFLDFFNNEKIKIIMRNLHIWSRETYTTLCVFTIYTYTQPKKTLKKLLKNENKRSK